MTYIPDPIERMESQIESNIDRWDKLQADVPEGSFRCMLCEKVFEGEPMPCGPHPDAPAGCDDCSGCGDYMKNQHNMKE